MLAGKPSARAFGLRDGIHMEATQTNVYHAPACIAIACQHYAIDSIAYNLLTRQEA